MAKWFQSTRPVRSAAENAGTPALPGIEDLRKEDACPPFSKPIPCSPRDTDSRSGFMRSSVKVKWKPLTLGAVKLPGRG